MYCCHYLTKRNIFPLNEDLCSAYEIKCKAFFLLFNEKIEILKDYKKQYLRIIMRKNNNRIGFNMKKSNKYGKKKI
ncbi:hypothetical protein DKE52_011615 [Acinetobacter pittii]|uniref:Uncharacterized protein n=1 Tax=Acinetobacter pittii TaxID=48296 RepID=A0A3G6YKB8_ACIPI|nr:hypothetical protein DKE52_011615 [Acinetobacter pittii]